MGPADLQEALTHSMIQANQMKFDKKSNPMNQTHTGIKQGKKSSPVKKKGAKEPSTREQIANLVEMQLQASQQVIKHAEN